jgi:hypothetical protein
VVARGHSGTTLAQPRRLGRLDPRRNHRRRRGRLSTRHRQHPALPARLRRARATTPTARTSRDNRDRAVPQHNRPALPLGLELTEAAPRGSAGFAEALTRRRSSYGSGRPRRRWMCAATRSRQSGAGCISRAILGWSADARPPTDNPARLERAPRVTSTLAGQLGRVPDGDHEVGSVARCAMSIDALASR